MESEDTLALTPALSPGERGSAGAALEKFSSTVATAASLRLAPKPEGTPLAFLSRENGEWFTLSWGRGPG